MRGTIPASWAIAALALITAACGGGDSFPSTTTTTGGATTTPATTTSSSAPTTTATTTTTSGTTTTTTLPPGATPVDHAGYCVRGTAPNDALNVRSGPGTGFDPVGELAWNAAAVPAGGLSAPDDRDRPWYLVEYPGGIGWAAAWYLEPAPCDPAAIAVAPLAGPGFPDALAGSLVPWSWVDDQWALALYTPAWGGDFALYLVGPYGQVFEVYSWPRTEGPADPFDLMDWRPDARAALAGFHFPGEGKWQVRVLDLETRTSRTVVDQVVEAFEPSASFTRPTGREVVVRTNDDYMTTERIEVRRTDGTLYSTLLDHPRPDAWIREATWLYGLEGTTVVIGDGAGLRLVTNQGDPLRDLASPGEACRPVRWWDEATVLARCIPPEILDYLPQSAYTRLWLVPFDGSGATPLTALPDETSVGDYGFSDASRVGDGVFANWWGDCGAASVNLVRPDGSTESIAQGSMIGTIGPSLLVRQWEACDGSPGSLRLVTPDGTVLATLLAPPTIDAWGVIDALMLGDLP
jgi:hypothetical protein